MNDTEQNIDDDIRNIGQTAAFFGVAKDTVKSWIDRGCPVEGVGKHGVSYSLSLRRVAAWRSDQAAADAAAERARSEQEAQLRLELLGPSALPDMPGLDPRLTPKQRSDAIRAELDRIRLAREQRELIPFAEVDGCLRRIAYELKANLLNLPEILSNEMGLSEAQTLTVHDIVLGFMEDCSNQLKRLTVEVGPQISHDAKNYAASSENS